MCQADEWVFEIPPIAARRLELSPEVCRDQKETLGCNKAVVWGDEK